MLITDDSQGVFPVHNKSAGLGFIPSFSILILAVGLMNHVMVLPPLLHEAKRDAWLSVLATIPPYLAWAAALYYIIRKTDQQPLLPWLEEHFGKAVSLLCRALFLVYVFFICALTLKETAMWAHASYLPRTPQIVLSAALVLLCAFAVHSGIRAIAIASGILLPFVVIFGDVVMSSNLHEKQYAYLTPLFEHGWLPVMRGSMYIGGGLAELILILLMQHHLKKKMKFWPLALLSLFLIGLVFGPVTGAISEFGPAEAAKLRYPAYEQWRLVTIGKYVKHVDFLSIYQWLSGAFARISLSLYFMMELLIPARQEKSRTIWLAVLSILVASLIALPVSDMQYLFFLQHVYLPWSLWIVTGVLLVLFLMVFISKKARMKRNA